LAFIHQYIGSHIFGFSVKDMQLIMSTSC